MSILENIHGHDDLLRLSDGERLLLCKEIRDFLVFHVSRTGGHLASNLGAVELSVAIETVYNTMLDRLVFDVGHQSYVHKLLTGRQADFQHLRQFGGISGFPKPTESESDAFVAGHASSSVSIALGMARARTLMGDNYHVVALLGDGAATGGMVFEGLNDAAESREPMVIILNDNEMSIDKNVGGVSRHLNELRMKEQYLGMKRRYRGFMKKFPGGKWLFRLSKNIKDRLKRFLLPATIFENMGLKYLGPVDGHDLPALIRVLKAARDMNAPVVVHVITRKGNGYAPAEQDPARFHGIGKFDPHTGESVGTRGPSFSDSFGKTMVSLAEKNPRICTITAAMPAGTGLLEMKEKFPDRTFDVGIAEEHAVSMAGGLAKQGMIPVVAIYSTFLQRGFDQIMQDIGLLNLHVVFAVDRAGLVGEDGSTHHGVFDVGFLRQVPGMTILAPSSLAEQSAMLTWAVETNLGPVAVRYPRGGNGTFSEDHWNPDYPVVTHRSGSDVAIVTYGTLVNAGIDAADILSQRGIAATVVRLTRIHPLPVDALEAALSGFSNVIILEEACSGSGIRDSIAAAVHDRIPNAAVYGRDLGREFIPHGSVTELYKDCGLDPKSVADYVQEVLGK